MTLLLIWQFWVYAQTKRQPIEAIKLIDFKVPVGEIYVPLYSILMRFTQGTPIHYYESTNPILKYALVTNGK